MKGAFFVAGFIAEIFGFAVLVVAADALNSCAGYPPCSANPLLVPIGAFLTLVGLAFLSAAYLMAAWRPSRRRAE